MYDRNQSPGTGIGPAKQTKGKGQTNGTNLCRMGVGVIAGGLLFVGQAEAAPIVSESFEASPSELFGDFSSYGYHENYTGANYPPGAGARYFTGDSGVAQGTRNALVPLTNLTSGGVPNVAIDTGVAGYDLSAYFSSYMTQGDFSEVRLQFTDASGAPLGDLITIGGREFVAAIPIGPNDAGAPGYKNWAPDSATGVIPAGARTADLTIYTERLGGTAADGYLDLLQLNLSIVPEPGGLSLAAVAAALVGLRRRRHSPHSG